MAAPFPYTGTSTDALRERAMNAVAVSDETASWRELDRRLREGDKFPSAWSSSVRLRRFREAMRQADAGESLLVSFAVSVQVMDAATRRHWLAGYASGMGSEACREAAEPDKDEP